MMLNCFWCSSTMKYAATLLAIFSVAVVRMSVTWHFEHHLRLLLSVEKAKGEEDEKEKKQHCNAISPKTQSLRRGVVRHLDQQQTRTAYPSTFKILPAMSNSSSSSKTARMIAPQSTLRLQVAGPWKKKKRFFNGNQRGARQTPVELWTAPHIDAASTEKKKKLSAAKILQQRIRSHNDNNNNKKINLTVRLLTLLQKKKRFSFCLLSHRKGTGWNWRWRRRLKAQ